MSGKPGFYRSYSAESVINPYTLACFGVADGSVTQAVDGSKFIAGPTQIVGADAIGEQVDICRAGLPEVTAGGIVTKGDPLTSDANGNAITAVLPAQGQSIHIVGYAEQNAVAGDIFLYWHAPAVING